MKCFGCDAYLLGSLVVFFFAGASSTGMLMDKLRPEQHWRTWAGTYAEIRPTLLEAFSRAVADFGPAVPAEVRDDLVGVVRELCVPDPDLRGHPRNRVGSQDQYGLERYVSKFNLLASRAEYRARGAFQ